MAYSFDNINRMFRGKDQNADVMGGRGGSTFKTSASGDITGGSSGAATGTGGEAPAPQASMAASGAAIKRNVGRAQTPGFVSQIQGQIQAGQQGLEGAQQAYKQKYENQDYGVSSEDINAAVSGNAEKMGAIQTRMATPKYGQVESFKPEVDTEIEDAALLGSEQGTRRLLARGAGSRYNAGESAFDASLLRRNQGFNQIADQLARQGKELSQRTTKLQAELPKAAQETADVRYEEGTKKAKETLGLQEAEVLKASQEQAAKVNAERETLRRQADTGFIQSQRNQALALARADAEAMAPRATRFVDQTGIDPNAYYQIAQNISPDDVLAAEDAARFNRIQQMLGTGLGKAVGAGAGESQRFDVGRFQQDVANKALGMRSAEDERLKARMAEIDSAAQARAQEYNQRIGGEEQARFQQIRDQLLASNPNLRASFENEFKNLNQADFIQARSQVGTGDVYTQAEADEINNALKDLGSMAPRASVKNWQQDVNVDEAAMNKLVADRLAAEQRLREAVNTQPRPLSPVGQLGSYVQERGEAAKDYVGARNPFRRK